MKWISILIKIVVVAVAFIVGPVLMLWAVNTLFPQLHIPYTWDTWGAAFILSAPFSSGAFRGKA